METWGTRQREGGMTERERGGQSGDVERRRVEMLRAQLPVLILPS